MYIFSFARSWPSSFFITVLNSLLEVWTVNPIQSSGKPIEHFLADDQFLSLHVIIFVQYFYEDMGKEDRCAVYGCDNDRRYPIGK